MKREKGITRLKDEVQELLKKYEKLGQDIKYDSFELECFKNCVKNTAVGGMKIVV